MKRNYFLTVLFLIILSVSAHSQSRFGVTAGYVGATSKATFNNGKVSDTEAGFYAGIVLDNKVSEILHLQVELTYLNVDDLSFLQLPILTKVYIAESPFNIQGGLQITYTLEKVLDDFTKFNIGLGGGLGYDITEDFFVEGRYFFQLNNYFTGPDDILESRINFLNIGLGYRF